MRIIEIILLLTVTVLPFIKRKIAYKTPSNYILIGLGLLLSLHLIFEGWRWQMTPSYLLLIILGWRVIVVDVTNKPRLSAIRIIGYIGLILIAAIGWVLPSVLPVFDLPETKGQYEVGSRLIFHESDMDETITEDPSDKRNLMFKIWYPSQSDVSGLKSEKYLDQAGREGFATKYGLPASALNYLDRIETNVYKDIPIADGDFPVLIFSHGYGSNAYGYYSLLAELTSQGYIIINMNHTYESLGSTFPNSDKKFFDYDFQYRESNNTMAEVEPLIQSFKDGLSYEERHPIVRKSVVTYYRGPAQGRWVQDMIYTIDLLESWNSSGFLQGKLDLDRLGVFGHSHGGGSAGTVPIRDSRVKAAANIDGISWGDKIDTTYQIPFLYISADWSEEHEDINSHVYLNKSTDYFYESKLLSSGHPNFMDIPFMIPISALAGTGSIDPYLGIEITATLVTQFFNKHLRNDPDIDLAQVGREYELLDLKIHKGDSIN